MKQTGRIVSIDGEIAAVSVSRMSACDSCHKGASECTVCRLSGASKKMTVRVKNTVGAAVGDTVELEARSSRVLLYAFLVFLLPILCALSAYLIADAFTDRELFMYLWALGAFALPLAVLFIVFGVRRAENNGITMTGIVAAPDEGNADN